MTSHSWIMKMFPSPHSGILFLYCGNGECSLECDGFPSPHSGILFLSMDEWREYTSEITDVSVPSFGDSFFMKT